MAVLFVLLGVYFWRPRGIFGAPNIRLQPPKMPLGPQKYTPRGANKTATNSHPLYKPLSSVFMAVRSAKCAAAERKRTKRRVRGAYFLSIRGPKCAAAEKRAWEEMLWGCIEI